MKQSLVSGNTKAATKISVIVVLGCIVGAYAVTAAFMAVKNDAALAPAIPSIAAVETSILAEKDAEIVELGAAIDMLQAENETLVSENVELLSDLATVLIEKTRLETSASRQATPTYAIENASMSEGADVVELDAALRQEAIEGSSSEGGVGSEVIRTQPEIADLEVEGVMEVETASTYLALLQNRYETLNAEGTTDVDLGSFAKISDVLDGIDREAILFAEGLQYEFTDAQRDLYEQYRVALLSHQSELMPQLRDAFGPAMRAKFSDQGYSMVTSGKGYRTATLKSDQFFSTSEIEQFHAGIHEWMVRMRFKEAVYMDADGTQIHGTVDLNPIPDDSLLINDSLISKSVN